MVARVGGARGGVRGGARGGARGGVPCATCRVGRDRPCDGRVRAWPRSMPSGIVSAFVWSSMLYRKSHSTEDRSPAAVTPSIAWRAASLGAMSASSSEAGRCMSASVRVSPVM